MTTLERTPDRRLHTVALALAIPSFALRPRNPRELEALFDLRGTDAATRAILRRAYKAGQVVFYAEDTGLYATRSAEIRRETALAQFDAALVGTTLVLRTIARQLIAGEIDIVTFEREAAREIEATVWEAGLLLVGPLLALSALAIWLLARITEQLAWLRRLVEDILAGRQRLDGSLLRRLGMYAGAGHSAAQGMTGQLALLSGMTEERNVLGIAEHCDGCLRETGRGWVPIGHLVPIGSRDCLSNCRCTYEYR